MPFKGMGSSRNRGKNSRHRGEIKTTTNGEAPPPVGRGQLELGPMGNGHPVDNPNNDDESLCKKFRDLFVYLGVSSIGFCVIFIFLCCNSVRIHVLSNQITEVQLEKDQLKIKFSGLENKTTEVQLENNQLKNNISLLENLVHQILGFHNSEIDFTGCKWERVIEKAPSLVARSVVTP